MPVWLVIIIVILVIVVIGLVLLYFAGSRLQRRQAESETIMEQTSQIASILVIDKKIMKLKESGLPQQAIDQTPWYMRRSKVPIVKAKVGSRIMVLMADNEAYSILPLKCEAKVVLSGIYIREVKSVRGQTIMAPPKKKRFRDRFRRKNKSEKAGKTDEKAKDKARK